MKWTVGHPERNPCHCLATGELVCGQPRFLLAVQQRPWPFEMTWRLYDRSTESWISGDLGADRDGAAKAKAEEIIATMMEENQ